MSTPSDTRPHEAALANRRGIGLMLLAMTAFIVISWPAYALPTTRTRRSAVWGVLAGAAAVAAFFTKAAAAFFIAALVLEVIVQRGAPGG